MLKSVLFQSTVLVGDLNGSPPLGCNLWNRKRIPGRSADPLCAGCREQGVPSEAENSSRPPALNSISRVSVPHCFIWRGTHVGAPLLLSSCGFCIGIVHSMRCTRMPHAQCVYISDFHLQVFVPIQVGGIWLISARATRVSSRTQRVRDFYTLIAVIRRIRFILKSPTELTSLRLLLYSSAVSVRRCPVLKAG